MTDRPDTASRHYQSVARAIEYIRARRAKQPSLGEIARHVNLSEAHFQRLFSEFAGVSPKRYMRYLTLEYAKSRLNQGASLESLAYEAGLSGASRLHDLFVDLDAMTPGEYRSLGADITLRYGVGPTPFGDALIASTTRGVCHLAFLDADADIDQAVQTLRQRWPLSALVSDTDRARAMLTRIFQRAKEGGARPLKVLVKGTNFQIQVWRALINLPPGQIASYGQMAAYLGKSGAARAVGSAIAANHVGYLIPCHRVIRENGELSRYRWGATRKGAMLAWEAGKAHANE